MTRAANLTKEEVIKGLQIELTRLEKSANELMEKLTDDFLYGFTWYSKELYIKKSLIREITNWLSAIEDDKCTVAEMYDYQVRQIMQFTPNTSSCPLTVQKGNYYLEVCKEIIRLIDWL